MNLHASALIIMLIMIIIHDLTWQTRCDQPDHLSSFSGTVLQSCNFLLDFQWNCSLDKSFQLNSTIMNTDLKYLFIGSI